MPWQAERTERGWDGSPEMDNTLQAAASGYDWVPEPAFTSTMTLNLVSNSYLEENTAKIRVKQVPWEVRLVVFTVSHLIRIERANLD